VREFHPDAKRACDLRLMLGNQTQDLPAVAGFRYHENAWQFLQQRSDTGADERMVVGNKDADLIHGYLAPIF
jgi:hypothetical protein